MVCRKLVAAKQCCHGHAAQAMDMESEQLQRDMRGISAEAKAAAQHMCLLHIIVFLICGA